MKEPKPNPAFPINGLSAGLTKREWFAGMALQGILAGFDEERVLPFKDDASRWAFDYADAMLAESQKTGGGS